MKLEESVKKTILETIAKKAAEQELDDEQVNKLIDAAIKAVTTDGLKNASGVLADKLKHQIPEMLTQEKELQAGFEQRLHDRWGKALDLYDAIDILARECGDGYAKQHRKQAAKDHDLVFAVMMRIHVKACQTASVVGVLLKSSYARDAFARQRTLHELATIAFFIKKHGQDTAERFWLHQVIESYEAAKKYELHCKKLGYDPHDPAELAGLRSQRDRLIKRFGKVFGEQYGWAAQALGIKSQVTFASIEKDVQLDHLRPYCQMANYGVHANTKGLIFDIGSMERTMLLAGASNAGLADPGQLALISLLQCTTAFLTLKNDLETLMKIQALDSLVHEACQAFIEIHRNLEREEEEIAKAKNKEMQENVL